jgi:hypothetical protein
MTKWLARSLLAGLVLVALGLVLGLASSSNDAFSNVALFGGLIPGWIAVILVDNLLGKRVFGSLLELLSLGNAIRFRRQLYFYGIGVAWRNAW